jgi:glycosyltransferase involved in cell wall biosynthesis
MSVSGKKIRVLNILHDERLGGPQIRVITVAKGLKESGIETIIALPKGETDFAEIARKEGFKVYQITRRLGDPKSLFGIFENVKYLLTLPFVVYQLSRIIQRESVDVIHNNASLNITGFIVALISRTKLVWHLNDTGTPKIIRRIVSSVIAKYADVIIVASKQVAEYHFESKGVEHFVIYPPVEVKRFVVNVDESKTRLKAEFKLQEEDIIVGTVGNINPEKGLEYFIKAAKLVKDHASRKGKSVKFVIVGGMLDSQREYYNELRKLQKKLGLDSDLIFTGFRADIPEILALMDVFVLSSISEGCPIALLEALASRTPVVATNVGGIPEHVVNKKTGIVVPSRDHNSIARAVIELVENPKERIKMEIQGRKRAKRLFSPKKCVEEHERVYDLK